MPFKTSIPIKMIFKEPWKGNWTQIKIILWEVQVAPKYPQDLEGRELEYIQLG